MQTTSPQVRTAAAEKLADRLAKKMGNAVGETWQFVAMDMLDKIPELRAAARITGQAMSQCRFVIARTTDGEPAPLDLGTVGEPGEDVNHPAQLLLNRFAGGQGGQSAWLDMVGVHLTVTGESIGVGALDTTEENDHELATWAAYSPEQVTSRNKVITVKTDDNTRNDVIIHEEEDGVTAVRIWRPHPRFSWQADSAARAALGAMQEILLYDQHIESSAVSRLISAGMMGIPDGVSLPGLPADEDSEDLQVDPFVLFLMQVMGIAIKDRSSAAARIPIIFRGDKEDIDGIRQFSFDTPFDDKVLELRTAAIRRLAISVDMPNEILTGLGATQHWTGALITQDWVNNYLQSIMAMVCGSLTTGWLHPALAAQGNLEGNGDIIVWFDSSSVRVRENIGPETQWLWENGLVGDDTARRVFGMDDSDKPSDEEYQHHMLISLLQASPALAPLIFPLLGVTFTPEQLDQVRILTEVLTTTVTPDALPQDGTTVPTDPGNQQPTDTTKIAPPSGGSDGVRPNASVANGARQILALKAGGR